MAVPNEVGTSPVDATPEDLVAYETLDDGRIARIWLNRPEAHNAQS
ncbi:MAG TPA: enoyl-CoA hydratase, partial [Mycobacterium sp.]